VKPPFNLLTKSPKVADNSEEEINQGAMLLEDTLASFSISSKVVNVSRGPAITRYELQPAPGVKISRIVNLSNDIALSMAAPGVRIEAPIPGKAAIGVEVPNTVISIVKLRDVIEGPEFQKAEAALSYCLGKDIAGKSIVADLAKMPHLLIAGATGSGKSVCINTMIISILYKSSPENVRMLMIDPKVVELNVYNGIPHLLIPVVTDPKKAAGALNWAVQEMMRRYALFAEKGARDLHRYNELIADEEGTEKLPQIVIVVDELADLMMTAPNEVEDAIFRLAQMARAAGMHLVIATQRPSVDVITGVIKANIPSRIAFAVSSQVDSRTILDVSGAEKLLGRGDMLFNPSGANKPLRIQGAYITENEVEKVVEFIKQQGQEVDYDDEVLENVNSYELPGKKGKGGSDEDEGDSEYSERKYDALLKDAAEVIFETGQASISMVQRRLRVGYARAARLVDEMEELGIVSPSVGSKPRDILKTKLDALQTINQYTK
jgi:S-DNA-T family DNA segregation ATPase FtsK/SpoIIIE